MKLALIGQPNCGKSTIFNQLAGYKSISANFPGATVSYTIGKFYFQNKSIELVDLPGTYSLSWYDDAEKESVKALSSVDFDCIINVLDASTITRGLELTLELISLNKPMVVALNMMDEAKKKGIDIDITKLEDSIGVKVVPVIAKQAKGIKDLINAALKANPPIKKCIYSKRIESLIQNLEQCLENQASNLILPPKLIAIKAIEGFSACEEIVSWYPKCQNLLEATRVLLNNGVEITKERHALCLEIFEYSAKVKDSQGLPLSEKIDEILLHPIWGYVSLFLIFIAIFFIVFEGGSPFESLIDKFFTFTEDYLSKNIHNAFLLSVTKGGVDGIGAAIGIALPYLVPFFVILSVLEDSGYLSRIAFLMDSLMHKIGVHGTSVIPFIMGYGCSVPAVMATRIIKDKREKFISAFLATLVPCAARTTVIMGLVAFFIGPLYAILLYLLNLIVIGFAGVVLKKFLPGVNPEILFDIPPYRTPTIKTTVVKTWYRIKDFVYVAIPLLVGGSIVLALIDYFNFAKYVNYAFMPFMGLLGLPISVGIVLIFGIFKKELTLLMLAQALGLSSIAMVSKVLTVEQIFVFTIFVMFYIPCLATISTLYREIKLKGTLIITLSSILIASILAFITHLLFLFI
ncbi:Ferrous iron transport protein B [Desulfurella amilsii]|uniref:Ferrous iron transport protein B n=1 Tax=Desulfurella amilsii TaxID=1562698 RepID=A0A1X4XVH2_9BACT|nr:ferrous iron transport protein B [Desulfurella amilsii]OSS41553.1 Ferrous iron transport protein B [Desulfurella amilsii]